MNLFSLKKKNYIYILNLNCQQRTIFITKVKVGVILHDPMKHNKTI